MSIEVVLFLLRLGSGLLLFVILAALFVIIWRDYHQTTTRLQSTRRIYGQLVVLANVNGNHVPTGEAYPLLPLTSLGRSPTNSIIVRDSFASSEHALVALRDGQWWLEDRQSRNGTILNGELISGPVVITHGDIISIGNMSFRMELDE